jgi:hypothetical protein
MPGLTHRRDGRDAQQLPSIETVTPGSVRVSGA